MVDRPAIDPAARERLATLLSRALAPSSAASGETDGVDLEQLVDRLSDRDQNTLDRLLDLQEVAKQASGGTLEALIELVEVLVPHLSNLVPGVSGLAQSRHGGTHLGPHEVNANGAIEAEVLFRASLGLPARLGLSADDPVRVEAPVLALTAAGSGGALDQVVEDSERDLRESMAALVSRVSSEGGADLAVARDGVEAWEELLGATDGAARWLEKRGNQAFEVDPSARLSAVTEELRIQALRHLDRGREATVPHAIILAGRGWMLPEVAARAIAARLSARPAFKHIEIILALWTREGEQRFAQLKLRLKAILDERKRSGPR